MEPGALPRLARGTISTPCKCERGARSMVIEFEQGLLFTLYLHTRGGTYRKGKTGGRGKGEVPRKQRLIFIAESRLRHGK